MTTPEQSMEALRRAIADMPHRIAEVTERVNAISTATVTGQDESGSVTVTASGQGQIISVRVEHRALREWDASVVAARVTTAVNAALTRAEVALEEAAADPDTHGGIGMDDSFRAFAQRMEATLDRLERLNHDIDRLLD
ncbi:YbaB/EbfC family nucleoid-associated protein [Actinoplanes sp. NPDC020271]|uniref:YbaB/EbfC family nucleoid-associated protein n=1 Tax=Actinoplanes sp. NPDC020271 TaxID=3363896 RepID=UPI00378C9C1D